MTEHPTPQRRRADWLDLCGHWEFAYDDADVGLAQRWWEQRDVFDRVIAVPFPPESVASGIGDTAFHSVVWYRRELRLKDVPGWRSGRRLILHFGAVDYAARVWLNGALVATHEGGHTPFQADVTDALHEGDASAQVLVVRAIDSPTDLTQPRGKQFWEPAPRRVWYPRTTGIWQPVWAEAVNAVHIASLRWTSDVARGVIGIDLALNRELQRPLRLRLRLSLRGEMLADDLYTVTNSGLSREIRLVPFFLNAARDTLLWSPRHPNLVDAAVQLEDELGQVLDRVESYVGLRSIDFDHDLLVLNGMPEYLRMVLSQGFWPDTHLAAPSADAVRDEVALIKELGFNGVRVHQKIEDPRFLHECDRQGLLVWAEMPSAYAFGCKTTERLTREWLEVLARDFSSPSIVAWVPFNESWGVPQLETVPAQRDLVRSLYYLTKSQDPTRPVIGNDGWEHVESDILGIHDYALSGEALRQRWGSPAARDRSLSGRPCYPRASLSGDSRGSKPVVISEMGGISYHEDPTFPWHGYGAARTPTEIVRTYEDLVGALLEAEGLAGFCYTQLTDTAQECNGLLDAQRRPKVDPSAIASINRRPARGLPGEELLGQQSAPLHP